MPDNHRQIKYPIGIQTFPDIIEGGYVYVDKTKFVHQIVSSGKYYFLSRPRRFGKSLLLSTIESYFKGRRELFKGLAIDSLTDDWNEHPVLHLDLNAREYNEYEDLQKELNMHLERWEKIYGDNKKDRDVEERFSYIIERAYEITGRQVVILVDEYDKPMLNAINNEDLADRFRSTLKAFYGNLQSMDRYIRFGMLTGVARFSRISIFSDLNNLRDITFEPDYSTLCGVTNNELNTYFHEGIKHLAEKHIRNKDEIRDELRKRYDGYHFALDLTDVYNPFSLMCVFASRVFKPYWFMSGTPTYLVDLIRKKGLTPSDLEGMRIDASRLESEGILSKDIVSSLFQTGYLTIKDYSELTDRYTLGYPNREVELGFFKCIMPIYTGKSKSESEFEIGNFVEDVNDGRPEDFMNRLSSILAGIPHYGAKELHESHFQSIIYLLFKMLGFYSEMESHTSDGRIDLTVETREYIYIFEFKINSNAKAAVEQIRNKKYWHKFKASGKKVFLIGASFDTSKCRLKDYLIQTLQLGQ